MAQNRLTESQLRAGVSITAQTAPYTLTLEDTGTCVSTDRNVTIPANSSVSFRNGATVSVFNANTTSNITISITTDTLYMAGNSSATGTQNLVPYGVVTLFKVANTTWVAAGPGYGD